MPSSSPSSAMAIAAAIVAGVRAMAGSLHLLDSRPASRYPRAPAMQPRTVDLLGGPVHAVELPGHGPPFVLVHGLGGSHLNWAPVAPLLQRATGRRVLALDLVG